MAIDGDDQRQAESGFGSRDCNREKHEHNTAECLRVFAIAPKGDEVQVGGIEHQFNADQHQNGVASNQRASQSNGEKRGGDDQIMRQRTIHGARLLSCKAMTAAPIKAAVSSNATISSGST